MSPDEVIERLSKIGVNISRATLLRYENQELIPRPKRGGGGPGGRYTDYPENTIKEAYAAWRLLRGEYGLKFINADFFGGNPPKIKPSTIKYIRFKKEMQELCEKVASERAQGIKYPMLDELDRLRELDKLDRISEIDRAKEEKSKNIIGHMPEWMKIYYDMYKPLSKFLSLVWEYEIAQAEKKLDAVK